MESEHKSRYELWLEEEARKAQPTKQCRTCTEVKAVGDFPRGALVCKACRNSSMRKYKDRNDFFWKRYWTKVKRTGDCLEWQGAFNAKVPRCDWKGSEGVCVRRIVYRLSVGELSDSELVFTTCGNNRCVRQSHLKRGTKEDAQVKLANTKATGDRNGSRLYPDRRPHFRGSTNQQSKLTEDQVRQIRNIYEQEHCSRRTLAQRFGVSDSLICMILKRKLWKHVE